MSKSPVVIGAIGLAGCVAMSLMMREMLEVHRTKNREPLELELESHFSARLVGPVRVVERDEEGWLGLVVELKVLAGLRKERIADAAGRLVWGSRRGADNAPDEVRVIVTDDGDGEPLTATVPRPPYWR